MAFLTWSQDYSIGLSSIDEQHKKLMAMINELHDGREAKKSKAAVESVLSQLMKYTVEHFQYEEELFEKTGYPLAIEHKLEHADLRAQAIEIQRRFEASQSGVLSVETLKFLKSWLIDHIQGTDKKYVPHLAQHGVS